MNTGLLTAFCLLTWLVACGSPDSAYRPGEPLSEGLSHNNECSRGTRCSDAGPNDDAPGDDSRHYDDRGSDRARVTTGRCRCAFVEYNIDVVNEIEGIVVGASAADGTLELLNGRIVRLGMNTAVDGGGDLLTLQAVELALSIGMVVRAEAEGGLDDDGFAARIIRIETDT